MGKAGTDPQSSGHPFVRFPAVEGDVISCLYGENLLLECGYSKELFYLFFVVFISLYVAQIGLSYKGAPCVHALKVCKTNTVFVDFAT